MRKALVAHGVPPRDVFEDHAGFDTWATMVRARALFLAEEAGIHATGLNADLAERCWRVLHRWDAKGAKAAFLQPQCASEFA
jgi:vancomycin permeability regulator SanA